jgi:NAD(P)-dependent dehydrogenase (short-subunit alcohol dehydrogenase family)
VKLNGEVAWVVGASSGIGAAVARELASCGGTVGPVDLAVLSAGYWKQMDPADWDTDLFDQHICVNLTGMSNAIAAVLPGMLQRHHGVIAGIASVAGYRGLAARSICDGLERDRTEIVFPPMALLMKTARLVPARAWTALWARTSLTDRRRPRPPHPAPRNPRHYEIAEDRRRRQAA